MIEGEINMIISGLQKLTLLDFPGYIACTIFTRGCNLRCPFCQNKGLAVPECFDEKEIIPVQNIIDFLKMRKSRLQGVCITGGEPTLQTDLMDFIRQIKDMGYKVKLDTNGTNPDMIKTLLDENLLDYIAMDIKNDLSRYTLTAGAAVNQDDILKSIDIIKTAGIEYEFRTTVVKELHDKQSFRNIAEMIKHVKNYSLQYYEETENVINPIYHTPSDDEMSDYCHIMQDAADCVIIKGR